MVVALKAWRRHERWLILGDFGILPLILKKNWQYAPVCKLYRGVPLFRYLITLKSSLIKYSIRRKSSYTRSNFKKKKFAWNSTFRKSSSMQKKIYKCDRPIFRESYSGVFNPYSDVLKPYSGVFLQNFFINVIAPYSGSSIVVFLSPIVMF